jgi:hypothetical protein
LLALAASAGASQADRICGDGKVEFLCFALEFGRYGETDGRDLVIVCGRGDGLQGAFVEVLEEVLKGFVDLKRSGCVELAAVIVTGFWICTVSWRRFDKISRCES